jgi:monovalent cation:H+ antiporter, CPA1 family
MHPTEAVVHLPEVVLIIMVLLTVAMLAAGICHNLPIPYTVFLVIIGIVLGSFARNEESMHVLLDFQLTPDIVLFLFLPALIFESAFNLNARQLVKDLFPVLVLAVPALLISTAFIGIGLWFFLEMDLVLALLFGALISATDPVAVISLFKELGAPERLTILVEGESLLNDATAIVVFKIILLFALSGAAFTWTDAGGAVFDFFEVFVGGALVGFVMGFVLSEFLHRLFSSLSAFMIMTIVVAYSSFVVAEHTLHVSGVMAVVASAITMGMLWVPRISQSAIHTVKETWEVIALISNSLLFLLVGLSVETGSLIARMDAIGIAILLVLASRAATIYTMVPATIKWFSLPHVSLGEQHIMWWGGLKGGLAIAIVLSVPEDLPGRDLLLDLTLGVVMFSLLVNAPTIKPLIQKLGIDKLTDDELAELKQGMAHAGKESSTFISRFYKAGIVSRSVEQLIQKNTDEVFASDVPDIQKAQGIRHLRLSALRAEFDELKKLHDINLIQHYTYLDIRNNIQRDRERIIANESPGDSTDISSKTGFFMSMENALLKRIREHDWAAWFLHRYQNTRLAHRMQRDIAGVLICTAVLEMLETHHEMEAVEREQIAEKYRERLQRRQSRLRDIAVDFPDFYARFETNLFTKVALTSARLHAEEEHHDGEIGAKALTYIESIIHEAISSLPPITDAAPRLDASDLIGTVPLLNGLPTAVLDQLSECAKSVTFLAGDIVIGEGERGDALYIITHGSSSVYKGDKEVAVLSDGDFFGEMALLGDQVRTATVKAKTPSTLLRLRRRDVMLLAGEGTELKRRLTDIKDERQTQTDLVGVVPLLSGLSVEVLELVVEQTMSVGFKPGDSVMIEGESGDSMFIIIHGVVSVYKGGDLIAELKEGDFFGEMALLGDQIRTATVKIKEHTALLKLSRSDILQLAETNPELKERLEDAKASREIVI